MTISEPEMVRSPLGVVLTILSIESVSPKSGSVSLAVRLMVLPIESSVKMAESLTAVGAVFEQLMVIVPVAIFEVARESCDRE